MSIPFNEPTDHGSSAVSKKIAPLPTPLLFNIGPQPAPPLFNVGALPSPLLYKEGLGEVPSVLKNPPRSPLGKGGRKQDSLFDRMGTWATLVTVALALSAPSVATAQLAVRGKTVYTMAGAAIKDGVVVIRDGKITAVGPASDVVIPDGFKVLTAEVVTPGLIDAHTTVGLTGIFNQDHDQDQIEHSAPIQPELRAIDAYNAHEELIKWVRSYGVTTIHAAHAPGEIISGQTLIAKTRGNTVDDAVIVATAAIAATLSPGATKKERGKSPGTRGKLIAMIRGELIKAREYLAKREAAKRESGEDETDDDDSAKKDKKPARDLRLEALGRVLNKELPLMVTANHVQDIANALRVAKEFDINIWLDSAAESYLMLDEIKAAGIPVIIHPPMMRAFRELKNMSMETASRLMAAGIPVAMQSGYESYVPKTRVVLFEAAIAAANGLTFEQALGAITIESAKILGIADRVGSLEVGKDGDLALYDGDPFEYTTHCVGVIIEGEVVSEMRR